ncbi:lysophospholipid acyltransferase family protein [Asticcacaulis sp. BYS171W]|uniref:Lysophospholipid acyltransferase family protein n=1 Tax=Asticcacaulis aquaticus TaxID=2984212 RepID=A0ABT5HNS8_9CAUL|nr:lysophospholipid acyltransferase family protein [Asticcacaulis aquaticus]MDC7681721.1 lysophospholipid acyltransferase family protein [Asticcacaulis aquaticus]
MRSFAFAVVYWLFSIFYSLAALVLSLLPGRKPVLWIIQRYTRRMVWAMDAVAGIRLEVRGRENVPDEPVIFAAKHQSWGDGFSIYAQFADLAFVTGDHLEKYPLMGTLLRKLGAIVVNNCGGHEARKNLSQRSAEAARDGRHILIYPEGHLNAPGTYRRYRSGVWHMYKNFQRPVVPVATNLGLFWQETHYKKTPGTAVLQFLEPIPVGLDKHAFMATLQARIEDASQALIAEGTGLPIQPSVLVDETPERATRRPKSADTLAQSVE